MSAQVDDFSTWRYMRRAGRGGLRSAQEPLPEPLGATAARERPQEPPEATLEQFCLDFDPIRAPKSGFSLQLSSKIKLFIFLRCPKKTPPAPPGRPKRTSWRPQEARRATQDGPRSRSKSCSETLGATWVAFGGEKRCWPARGTILDPPGHFFGCLLERLQLLLWALGLPENQCRGDPTPN